MLESEIKKAIKDYLKFVPKCEVFPIPTVGLFDPKTKRMRPTPGRVGTPDLLLCIDGRFVALEVKSETGRVSPKQQEVIGLISLAGGIAEVVRSVDDVKKVLSLHGFL